MIRSLVIYLGLTVGSAYLMWLAIEDGWMHLPALVAIQTASTLIIAGLEFVLPHRRDWLRSHGDVRTDLGHLLISTQITSGVMIGLGTGISWLATTLDLSIWPVAWPLVAQLALLGVIQSFTGYWIHRSQHMSPLLWRIHAIHHSAPRVYWLNQWRGHPLEGVYNGLGVIPIALMGAPSELLAIFTAFNAAHLVLQHSNIDLRFGPLNYVIAMNESHRWHHSRDLAESNTNFGGLLLIWDVLFKTVHLPPKPAPDAGIPDAFPTGYFAQLAAPFRTVWWKRDADQRRAS